MQMMQNMMKGSGKGYGKAAGYSPMDSWGSWGSSAKGNGKGQKKGQGKGGGEACGRCGGQHLSSLCDYRLNEKECHKCGRTGHAASHCRSKKPLNEEVCKSCKETGHHKKNCPHEVCTRCHKVGHTVWDCKQKAGGGQQQQQQQQQPANSTSTNMVCVPCGETNLYDMKWICKSCGCYVKDDADEATKCPRCAAPRKKDEPAAAKSLLPKFKATTEATFLRAAQSNDAAGSLTLPPQTKEAVDKATKLQEDISKLEGVEGAEEVLEAKKKALKLLQPKLPQSTQNLKDHGDLVNALRELEEKASSKEQELKGKLRKLMDDDLRIIAEAKRAVQQIAERAAQQKKDVETSTEQRTEANQEAIKEARKEIEDLKKEVDEKEKTLREKAGPLATALAAGDTAITFLPVVPGNVVHSNDVTPEAMKQAALADPMLATFGGVSNEQAEALVQFALTYFQSKSLAVAPKAAQMEAAAVPLQQLSREADEEEKGKTKAMEEDDVLTEPSDTEVEAERANAKEGDAFVVKKIPRKEKQEKKKMAALRGKNGSTAAASASKGVISKNAD